MFELSPHRRRHRDMMFGLIGWDPFKDMWGNEFMPRMFNEIRTDIKENDTEYIVEAELPGVKKEDLVVELRDNTLTIAAKTMREDTQETENYLRRERSVGQVSRSYYVENVDQDAVKADYKDGVLKIILPKFKDNKDSGFRIPIE
ncbi:HSP20-like chaperone [Syntrophomonas zehnderi OL-4]|uniref:HSP20-like chaperone n=1 Tax=Syntrophomonas zehnderi OL-4 TaxID=690567 RepID=A0A0E4GDL1_9FIRM|nr:Hsp20/alpha crystallin family protein [Syntrophomonas zehnderi]CFX50223.1 HSP20-like chaperone [Syntrophomonas zehnderi OL-4]